MSSKHQYIVTFFDIPFDSLTSAKKYISISFTRNEAKKYFTHAHEMIYHFINDRLYTQTPIRVDVYGNISFGRTLKVV